MSREVQFLRPWLGAHQLIESDRKLTNAFARGVKDGVADRRSGPGYPDLSDTAGPQWIELRVGNVQHRDIEFADIRMKHCRLHLPDLRPNNQLEGVALRAPHIAERWKRAPYQPRATP